MEKMQLYYFYIKMAQQSHADSWMQAANCHYLQVKKEISTNLPLEQVEFELKQMISYAAGQYRGAGNVREFQYQQSCMKSYEFLK